MLKLVDPKRFPARRLSPFRVSGGLQAELTTVLQVVDRDVVAGEMEQRVQQHRPVTVRQNETVAVRPVWIARVVSQVATAEYFGYCGHSHGHARVAGVGLLHRIHGKCTDDVGQVAGCKRHDN